MTKEESIATIAAFRLRIISRPNVFRVEHNPWLFPESMVISFYSKRVSVLSGSIIILFSLASWKIAGSHWPRTRGINQ